MRGYAVVFSLLLISVFVLCIASLFVYRTSLFSSPKLETLRTTIDTKSLVAYIDNNPLFKLINTAVYHNGDKYVFRPPRVLPSHTFRGGRAYEVFGMVTSWDPVTKLLQINSYVGKQLIVRFDPTADGSLAYVPLLNNTGGVAGFRDTDFVTRTDATNFTTLFCESDIVSLMLEKPSDINGSSLTHPIIPKEIRLSHRLCKN